MDAAAFRAHFPVLAHTAYLNAGTDGPLPAAALELAREELESEVAEGRVWPHFTRRQELTADLRAAYAQIVNAELDEVAVTTGTSFGLGAVLAGMDIGPGDEIVTSANEHPGLIGPLIAARRRGATVRAVPFAELADAVTPSTTIVAASHVNWINGQLAPAGLAELDIPVILDGAQGPGAIPVDVKALNCAAYAAAGQKWLCGADGTGLLYLEPGFAERVQTIAPTYHSFEDASQGLDSTLRASAERFDAQVSREAMAMSLAALQVLIANDFDAVLDRGIALAARFAEALEAAGYPVAPRDATTLVAFEVPEPEAARERLFERGVALRNLPGHPYLRASVGAWNDESDLDRLLTGLAAS